MTKVGLMSEDEQDAVEDALKELLPHGSGINCKWTFDWLQNGSLKCKNSFQCMNDVGYYDGFADFTVIFKPETPLGEFKLEFNGQQAQAKAKQYLLREYLEDDIYAVLPVNANLASLAVPEVKLTLK